MFLLRRFMSRSFNGDAEWKDGNLEVSNPKKFSDEKASRKALDQAGDYVRDGKYEKALWLLEKLGQVNPGVKGVGELVAVAEVCYAAVSRPCMCLLRKSRSPDWYKILKVDENSDIEVIKKRYRQLALLLHPDKNKHVKAEGAFKLVSEAYACLSDKKKRAKFNAEWSILQCRHCSQTGVATAQADRWSGYDCSRERKAKFRRARSARDTTQADWVLDQEKLKMFREKARARAFINLSDAWKERTYKSMGEFDSARQKSHGRKHGTQIPIKEVKHPEQQQQHRLNTGEQHMYKVKDCKAKPVLSPQAMSSTINRSHDSPLNLVSPKVIDKSSIRKNSDYEISRPCKSLDALIRGLRAELNASSKSTSNQNPKWDKSTEQEPVAGYGIKMDSKAGNEAESCSEEICKVLNSVQKFNGEGNDTSLKNIQGATGASSGATQRQMDSFVEASVAHQEAFHLADHNCSSSTSRSNSDLCDSSEKYSFNLDSTIPNHFLTRNLSSKVLSSITNKLHRRESGSPRSSPDKICSDPCTGGIEERHLDCDKYATCAFKGRKLVEEKCVSGVASSVADTFVENLVKQRTKGADCFNVVRNGDQLSPSMSTVCTNNFSHRRVCRDDSLDREETILQTQKEKSEQLLDTLQRLREEAKTVTASLAHIRYGRDNRVEGHNFFAAPSYQAFVWDTDG